MGRALCPNIAMDIADLTAINMKWNSIIKYVPDGLGNGWQTPQESIRRGFGDCEDIAIAKFFYMIEQHPDESVRLAHCLRSDGEHHMVVLVHPEYVMDNNREAVYIASRSGMTILYTFDKEHLWVGTAVHEAKLIKNWARVIDKHEKQSSRRIKS